MINMPRVLRIGTVIIIVLAGVMFVWSRMEDRGSATVEPHVPPATAGSQSPTPSVEPTPSQTSQTPGATPQVVTDKVTRLWTAFFTIRADDTDQTRSVRVARLLPKELRVGLNVSLAGISAGTVTKVTVPVTGMHVQVVGVNDQLYIISDVDVALTTPDGTVSYRRYEAATSWQLAGDIWKLVDLANDQGTVVADFGGDST